MGNIGGNLLVNGLREKGGLNWMWCFRIIGIWVGVLAVVNFLLLVDEPHKVHLIIELPEEEEEKAKEEEEKKKKKKIDL